MSADDQLDETSEENLEEELNTELPQGDDNEGAAPAFEEPTHNVATNMPYRVGVAAKEGHVLAIPTASYKRFSTLADGQDNLKIALTDDNRDWLSSVGESVELYQKDDLFKGTLEREGSEWTQRLKHNESTIGISRPKLGGGNGTMLSGEQAMLHIRSMTGLGTVSNVPLPHTGIWVKMKAPSDDTLLMLDGLIANEKYILGRMTFGKAFSHNSCYITKHVVDTILDHIYGSSIKGSTAATLRDKISILDYPILIHGFLCTIYPKGYDMSQPCVAEVGKCIHVTKAKVSIAKLLWNDRSSYTNVQLNMLAQRNRIATDDDLVKYAKESADRISTNTIVIAGNEESGSVVVRLRTPSISEDIDSGSTWVDSIVDTVQDAMRLNAEERNMFIVRRAQAQNICTYNGWVSSVDTIDENGETITSVEDRPTILDTLASLSESSEIGDKILTGIRKYIEESTKAVVGVPDFVCPVCNKSQLEGQSEYRHIIPINVEGVFFNLTRQRIGTAVTTREI